MNLPNLENVDDAVSLSHLFAELPRLTLEKDNLSSEYLEWISNNYWDYYCLVLFEELLNTIDYLNTTNTDSSEVVKAFGNSLDTNGLFIPFTGNVVQNHYRTILISGKKFNKLEISYKVRDYTISFYLFSQTR